MSGGKAKKVHILKERRRGVLISLRQAVEPVGEQTTIVCDAWPV